MSTIRVSADSSDQLVETLGKAITMQLSAAIDAEGEARIAVSGGSTPVPLFNYLSRQALNWQKVKLTLVDDRCVPAEHQDSNAKLVRDNLLINNASKAEFYPLVSVESILQEFDQKTESEANQVIQKNFPDYDVVILGMGNDAHTASIFPEAEELSAALDLETAQKCLLTHPNTANYWRITQTRAQLLKTELLVLHIVGKDKISLFESASAGPQDQFPISHFIHQTETPLSVYFAPQ